MKPLEEWTREELLEIVRKLPTTRDGVPITPGMEVWVKQDDGTIFSERAFQVHAKRVIFSDDSSGWTGSKASCCYSTEALARAALDAARGTQP